MIQHEIDHLDGVLILDRTPRDQRREAMRALRERRTQRPTAQPPQCAPSTSAPRTSPPASCARLADEPAPPALVVTRPDRPRGPRPRARRAAGRRRRRRARASSSSSPRTSTARRRARGSPPPSPRRLLLCAFGALIKEPLLSEHEILNVHPSLLPRWRGAAPVERAIMAGDERTGVSIMRLTAGLDSGPVCLQEASRSGPRTTYGDARRAARGARRASCSCARSTSARRSPSRTRRGVTYAEKIDGRRPHARPGAPRGRARAHACAR